MACFADIISSYYLLVFNIIILATLVLSFHIVKALQNRIFFFSKEDDYDKADPSPSIPGFR